MDTNHPARKYMGHSDCKVYLVVGRGIVLVNTEHSLRFATGPEYYGVVFNRTNNPDDWFAYTPTGGWFGCEPSRDAAVALVRTGARQMAERQKKLAEDPAFALGEALKSHDWFYYFSDDGNVVRRGDEAFDKIKALLKRVPEEDAKALWALHAPSGCDFPKRLNERRRSLFNRETAFVRTFS